MMMKHQSHLIYNVETTTLPMETTPMTKVKAIEQNIDSEADERSS
jgi:hypothetical protein